MLNNVCTAKDIFSLNETKEYVLTSSALLERVLTDNNLSPQSASLWQILYNLCKFDSDLSITISYQSLSTKLGKSSRTIMRYVSNLVKFGYLLVSENYTEDKTQISNTFKVRFPMDYIKNIKSFSKDRMIKPKPEDEVPEPEIDYSSDHSSYDYGDEDSNSSSEGSDEDHKPNNIITFPETNKTEENCDISSKDTTKELNGKEKAQPANENKEAEGEGEKYATKPHQEWGDNVDTEEGDKNVIHNTRERDLNITTVSNANTVVVSNSLKPQNQNLKPQETRIDEIKAELKLLGNSLDACEKAGQLESELQFLINAQQAKTEKQNARNLLTDATFAQQLPGDRRLSKKQFSFLETELSKYRSGMDVLITLNQIAYSICHGEMRYKKGTFEELDIDMAIIYALRFVKNNTWQEPNSLKKFLKGLVKA